MRRSSFPAVLLAPLFGDRFDEKPCFRARSGEEVAPPPVIVVL